MSPPAANSAASASSTSLCFHAKLPAKLAFVPYPWASSILLNALGGPYACSKTIGRADDISSVFNNIGRVGHLLLFWCFIRHQPPEPDAGSNLQNTKQTSRFSRSSKNAGISPNCDVPRVVVYQDPAFSRDSHWIQYLQAFIGKILQKIGAVWKLEVAIFSPLLCKYLQVSISTLSFGKKARVAFKYIVKKIGQAWRVQVLLWPKKNFNSPMFSAGLRSGLHSNTFKHLRS